MSKLSGVGPAPATSVGPLAWLRRLFFGKARAREAVAHSLSSSIDRPWSPRRQRAASALFAQMQTQLAAALSAAPRTRKSLRHLAHFEKSLVSKGSGALDALTIDRLRRAHSELLILLRVAPASVDLIALEKSMRDSLELRCARREPNSGVQVSDGTLADFDRVVIDTDIAQLWDH
jgi:hypothetical protein